MAKAGTLVSYMNSLPRLKPQEIPFDHPDSCCRFEASADKPLLATPMAIEQYTHETVLACYHILREIADVHQGLDYLQVFKDETKVEDLWFIEDG
ncbi:MAG: hypothetical protein KDB22_19420, partial [Planctomycetales bacterium]|nr:hypothetical protein [Planctomycetales bacterium]